MTAEEDIIISKLSAPDQNVPEEVWQAIERALEATAEPVREFEILVSEGTYYAVQS